MIEIYKLTQTGYYFVAGIDETDASVKGQSQLANYLRNGFDYLRSEGYEPADHIDKIRARIENNYQNGYYWVL